MRVIYLVNQYPKLSHSFIRREIAAVEHVGVSVTRVSVRDAGPQVDSADEAERADTHVILRSSPWRMLASVARACRTPGRLVRALGWAMRCGWRSDRGVVRHGVYLLEACVLLRIACEHDAEHIHAHFGTNSTTVAMLCRVLGGPTYSFTVHGPEEFDKPQALALGHKIAAARFVVAISSFGRSQLFRWCDASHWKKVHVVRCGLDARYLDASPQPVEDTPRLVSVGRLCEQKGQVLLVEAVGRLRDRGPAVELVLIGDGPMREDIEQRIAELGLQQSVKLVGAQENAAVQQWLAGARAMVLASFAEGLPVVIMEALAMGRPVVSTYIAGIPELVGDQACGWLVPAGDVDALARALAEVLQAPVERLSEMGESGAERVRAMHDARVEGARLARLFKGELPDEPVGSQPHEHALAAALGDEA